MAGCSVGHHTCQVLADAVGRVALRRALPPPLLNIHAPALLKQLAALRILVHLRQNRAQACLHSEFRVCKVAPMRHPCRLQQPANATFSSATLVRG